MDYRTLIREKRKEKGLSQERLAKLVQVLDISLFGNGEP